MTIDLKTIKHISKLSRISLEDEKAQKLAGDLSSIFEFIEKLKELKTDEVEPLTSIAETTLKFRTDDVKNDNYSYPPPLYTPWWVTPLQTTVCHEKNIDFGQIFFRLRNH